MPTERELRATPAADGGKGKKADVGGKQTVLAALSYVGILFLVPMIFAKKTPFVRFHLRQGLVLFVAEVIVSVIGWFPVIGWILGLGVLVLAVMGILQALAGEQRELPFLGKYAARVNI